MRLIKLKNKKVICLSNDRFNRFFTEGEYEHIVYDWNNQKKSVETYKIIDVVEVQIIDDAGGFIEKNSKEIFKLIKSKKLIGTKKVDFK
jgi:hypothetical protein